MTPSRIPEYNAQCNIKTMSCKVLHYINGLKTPQSSREIMKGMLNLYPDMNGSSIKVTVSSLYRRGEIMGLTGHRGKRKYIPLDAKYDHLGFERMLPSGFAPTTSTPPELIDDWDEPYDVGVDTVQQIRDKDIISALSENGGWMSSSDVVNSGGGSPKQSGGIAVHMKMAMSDTVESRRSSVHPHPWEFRILKLNTSAQIEQSQCTCERPEPEPDKQPETGTPEPGTSLNNINSNLEDRINALIELGAKREKIQKVCFGALEGMVEEYHSEIVAHELKKCKDAGITLLPGEIAMRDNEILDLKERIQQLESTGMVESYKATQKTLRNTQR